MAARDSASPFGDNDDVWLSTATELHHAVSKRGAVNREHLYDAIGQAIDLLGDERIDLFVDREWIGEHFYAEALAVLADDIHWTGAYNTAASCSTGLRAGL